MEQLDSPVYGFETVSQKIWSILPRIVHERRVKPTYRYIVHQEAKEHTIEHLLMRIQEFLHILVGVDAKVRTGKSSGKE